MNVDSRKISIKLELTQDECQVLLLGLKELIFDREQQALFIVEDCPKGAVQTRLEAAMLRRIMSEATRQVRDPN